MRERVLAILRGALLGGAAGVPAGLASALFLWALDRATAVEATYPGLLFGLPLAGAIIGLVYARFGKDVADGANLLIDRVHEPGPAIPFRMAPLVLVATVLTHLFGGSAGREGTAVQMGGTLADGLAKAFKASAAERRLLLMAGIAAGFGSVFGTPVAGAVFGIEVLAFGRLEAGALVPCLVASVVGDLVCRATGIRHHGYDAARGFEPVTLAWVVPASVAFALAAVAFVELTHAVSRVGRGAPVWVRPLVGGLVVVGLTLAVGTRDYNGLSLPLIGRAFHGVPPYAFALKLLLTAVTLGAGFKGGEVTPLFAIGATLGGAFASYTGQDPALFAALGFVAVFAAAANTPLACAIMGVELFGPALTVPLALACVLATLLSGHRGIYPSQRVHRPKPGFGEVERGRTLGSLRQGGRRVPRV